MTLINIWGNDKPKLLAVLIRLLSTLENPNWNDLTFDISTDTNTNNINYSCIFYRVWDPKAWEELYWDNFIVKEID